MTRDKARSTAAQALELSAIADLDLVVLGEYLASDVRRSLGEGIAAGAVLEEAGDPDTQFRAAVRRAITAIAAKDAEGLLPRFLTKGPYFDSGTIPRQRRKEFLSDEEVAASIRFIHSSAINSFQGSLAELLAVGPVCAIAHRALGRSGCTVFGGDAVLAKKPGRSDWGKAADFHLLDLRGGAGVDVVVRGVAEVKSYATTPAHLQTQLARHLRRPRRGLLVGGREFPGARVRVGVPGTPPIRICVIPGAWRLSREVRIDEEGTRTTLAQASIAPPTESDRVEEVGDGVWLVTLRWSQEALASVAYEMTFWYMGELGRMLHASGVPSPWQGMAPEEAGRNAAKMMLYYSLLRARTVREESRAIALYNSYCFGYSLGANFVDRNGRRCELFVEDLREIASAGRARTAPVKTAGEQGARAKILPPQNCRIRP